MMADLEPDMKEKNALTSPGSVKDVMLIATDHRRQGHLKALFQQICDCPHPTIENDVAGFCQRLLFKIENVFRPKLA